MRVFQNLGVSRTYDHFRAADAGPEVATYAQALNGFIETRYGALHILKPVLEGASNATLAVGNGAHLQKLWADERGAKFASLEDILLAQIEESGAEVFYNCDPLSYGDDFVQRLPGNVRRTVAWSAAPAGKARFFKHDVIVCNFPRILRRYEAAGARTAILYPGHDPVMIEYHRPSRDIDIVFAGAYSRHHAARNRMLEAVASLSSEAQVRLHIQPSRLTRMAESAGGLLPLPARWKRSRRLRSVSRDPVFGRDLYSAFGRSRIVLNGAIGMAAGDRGNLRVWEAMGSGALLLSDEGSYPPGFIPGENMVIYRGMDDLLEQIRRLLADGAAAANVAAAGHELIRTRYGKQRQWQDFQKVCQ